jgi:hypothetical protein
VPRKCIVCEHPDRAGIEFGLANRQRGLAKRYALSKECLIRHRRNHMGPDLMASLLTRGRMTAADLENLRLTESEGIIQTLAIAKARIFRQLDKAEAAGDSAAAVRALMALHRNVELMAKVVGEIPTGNQTINNIMIAPQYHALRQAMVYALKQYPEAQKALMGALESIEGRLVPAIEMH